MFDKTAELYDLIYSFKDYQKEAQDISSLIRQHNPQCKTVLDVGCGTGEHHKYLKMVFEISGLDVDASLLDIASRKNPDCSYHEGNMVSFDTGSKYDCIICMFSSIGYVQSYENTVATLKCFSQHLNEGGFVVIEPWISPDKFEPGKLFTKAYEQDGLHVCRMGHSTLQGNITKINFHYLIGRPAEGIQYLKEEHELGMLSFDDMSRAFGEAGFTTEYDPVGPVGRGLFIGSSK